VAESSDSTQPLSRGRPRRRLELPTRVMRELGHEMRLARLATGVLELKAAAGLINAAVSELYGADPDCELGRRRAGRSTPSRPRRIRAEEVSGFELGQTALEDGRRATRPRWLRAIAAETSQARVIRAFIPAWLAAGYDLAFATDGYLRDAYSWAVRLEGAYELDVPALPYMDLRSEAFDAGFEGAPREIRDHVDALAAAAETIEEKAREAPSAEWTPTEGDESREPGCDPLLFDGELVEPGGYRLVRFRLKNTGRVPWRDRVLVPLTGISRGADEGPRSNLHTVRYLPMGDVEPGGQVDVYCPLHIPTRPGTYRLSVKAAWPDGTLCFPQTFLGVMVMVVVPPMDFSAWWAKQDDE
jgi:hypothetical protein